MHLLCILWGERVTHNYSLLYTSCPSLFHLLMFCLKSFSCTHDVAPGQLLPLLPGGLRSLSVKLHVLLLLYFYVFCLCLLMHVLVHRWISEGIHRCHPSHTLYLLFETGCLTSLQLALVGYTGLSMSPRDLQVSTSSILEMQTCTTRPC